MSFLCGSSAVVSFGTTWCGPCAVLAPELATLAAALEDIPSLEDLDIAKVDAEEASSLASQHGIGAYPTTLWMREGREVHRMEGAAPAAALGVESRRAFLGMSLLFHVTNFLHVAFPGALPTFPKPSLREVRDAGRKACGAEWSKLLRDVAGVGVRRRVVDRRRRRVYIRRRE